MPLNMVIFTWGTPTFDLNKERDLPTLKYLYEYRKNSIESRSIERMGKDPLLIHQTKKYFLGSGADYASINLHFNHK
jgi:hypothetical protein